MVKRGADFSPLKCSPFGNTGIVGTMTPAAISKSAFVRPIVLARHLAVTDRTVRNWIRNGKIPGFRQGRVVRLRMSDALAALEIK